MNQLSKPINVFLLAAFLFNAQAVSAQLVVDSIYDIPTMANDFFDGSCVDLVSVTYQGSPMNMSFFEGSQSNIGLDMGILLSSGNVFDAVGPNDLSGTTTWLNLPGDADLEALTMFTTYDAAVLEMDIVPHVDTIYFDYVFASEEYPEWVGTSFNDVFGFFISGPGIAGTQNIALIPGSDLPVTINNVNCNLTQSPYYVCNEPNNATCDFNYTCPAWTDSTIVEYDGFTTPIKAFAAVSPDSTYHVKIAVSDASDGIFDSGIFLGIGSLCGDGEKPQADFNYVIDGSSVAFENLAKYVRTYYWSFGDGAISHERNPSHDYGSPGVYDVMLVTTNYKGSDTVIKTVDLLGTGIQNTLAGIEVLSNPAGHSISVVNRNPGPVEFYLFNSLGQLVKASTHSGNFSVNMADLSSGLYIAEMRASGKLYRSRVVKQ
jgi:PKD repeat protein